jgi:hypothetical protein
MTKHAAIRPEWLFGAAILGVAVLALVTVLFVIIG